MSDLKCTKCGITRSYADASIADKLRTCNSSNVKEHTALGPVMDGEQHDWDYNHE